MDKYKLGLILGGTFAALAILTRLVNHPANFTAVGAVAVMTGYLLRDKGSWLFVLLALLVSDLILGFYDWRVMVAVYAGFLLMWGVGRLASVVSSSKWSVFGAGLVGSLVFFLLTNAAVWAFSGMYAPTAGGLVQAYAMAIPFFKWSVLGNFFYISVFFAIVQVAKLAAERRQVSLSAHS